MPKMAGMMAHRSGGVVWMLRPVGGGMLLALVGLMATGCAPRSQYMGLDLRPASAVASGVPAWAQKVQVGDKQLPKTQEQLARMNEEPPNGISNAEERGGMRLRESEGSEPSVETHPNLLCELMGLAAAEKPESDLEIKNLILQLRRDGHRSIILQNENLAKTMFSDPAVNERIARQNHQSFWIRPYQFCSIIPFYDKNSIKGFTIKSNLLPEVNGSDPVKPLIGDAYDIVSYIRSTPNYTMILNVQAVGRYAVDGLIWIWE